MTERYWRHRCHATTKATGQPCQRWSIVGAEVCRVHGGAAKQVRQRGAERAEAARAQRSAADILTSRGIEINGNIDPRHALLIALEKHVRIRDALEELLQESGEVVRKDRPTALARLWLEQCDRTASLARDCTRLGVDVQRLGQRRAEVTFRAFEAAIHSSGIVIGEESREALAQAFAQELRIQKYAEALLSAPGDET